MTPAEIADDIIKNDPTISEWLASSPEEDDFFTTRQKLIEFPRWIRNHYKLWEQPTLPLHPDNFSAEVIKILTCQRKK